MRHALHILRKDFRGLRWEVCVTVAVTLGTALLTLSSGTLVYNALREFSPILAAMVWALLVVQLVQADALVGTEHDWRTRPIWLRDLVLGDVIVLMGGGFAPLDYLPGMAGKLLWLSVAILLPAAALGAITRTTAQALLAAVGTGFSVPIGLSVVDSDRAWWDWRWRWGCSGCSCVSGWRNGLGRAGDEPDAVAGVSVAPRLGGSSVSRFPPNLPIAVLGLPEGYRARVLRGRVTIDVDGQHVVEDTPPSEDLLYIRLAGHRDSPARIQAQVWLVILAPFSRQAFDAKEESFRVPGLGRCRMNFGEATGGRPWATAFCRAPYRARAAGSVTLTDANGSEWRLALPGPDSFSPFPAEPSLPPLVGHESNVAELNYGTSADGSRLTIETWVPVAYEERSFTEDVKRLGDCAAGELGDEDSPAHSEKRHPGAAMGGSGDGLCDIGYVAAPVGGARPADPPDDVLVAVRGGGCLGASGDPGGPTGWPGWHGA